MRKRPNKQYLTQLLPLMLQHPSNTELLQIITASHHDDYIQTLIQLMNQPQYKQYSVPARALYSTDDHPIQYSVPNPCYQAMLSAGYNALYFKPSHLNWGEQLKQTLQRKIATHHIKEDDLLKNNQFIKIEGGRTLQLTESHKTTDLVDFYKIQRQDEPLKDFIREAKVYHFIHHNPSFKSKLKSKIPIESKILVMPISLFSENILNKMDDPIATKIVNDISFVTVHHYQAPMQYYQYAHQFDKMSSNPFQSGESGILSAIFDIAALMSAGIIPSSTLPAFHDRYNHPWIAIHARLSYKNALPGTFGAWNTDATERPDYGFTGLRDWGDIAFYSEIQNYFKIESDTQYLYPEPVMQRFSFMNAICKNILSGVLLRSRLRQVSSEYHYTKPACQQETSRFIHQLLTQFIE
ncbi:MAG: hypothetical protein HAW62_06250 [Endozoicomonadaceae bacterium]|nr:hypothetical protein [Endozoicomonadaceae bacterium]